MLLSTLSEVVWQFFAEGRQKSTNRTFGKADVRQMLKLASSDILRMRYFSARKEQLQTGDTMDTSFISPLLSIQNFPLSDPNEAGMRRSDMSDFDIYRMPHNVSITNVYPVGCGGEEYKSIPIVEAGEEYFYQNPQYKSFKFGVVKGRGINTYNLKPCAKSLDVEAAFDGEGIDVDIPMDVAFEASNEVLGKMIGMPDFPQKGSDNPYTLPQKHLQQRLNAKQQQETTE